MTDAERIKQLEVRESRLCVMLSKATIRLSILRDRMEACDEEKQSHGLSLFEIEGWIEEQIDLLEGIND